MRSLVSIPLQVLVSIPFDDCAFDARAFEDLKNPISEAERQQDTASPNELDLPLGESTYGQEATETLATEGSLLDRIIQEGRLSPTVEERDRVKQWIIRTEQSQEEKRRSIQEILDRAAELERGQDEQSALTALELAVQLYPESSEISEQIGRLRRRISVLTAGRPSRDANLKVKSKKSRLTFVRLVGALLVLVALLFFALQSR